MGQLAAAGTSEPFSGAWSSLVPVLPHTAPGKPRSRSRLMPNHRGTGLPQPLRRCTNLSPEPPQSVRQTRDWRAAVTAIYIPEEKEKPFLAFGITQVAQPFPGRGKLPVLHCALITPREAVAE